MFNIIFDSRSTRIVVSVLYPCTCVLQYRTYTPFEFQFRNICQKKNVLVLLIWWINLFPILYIFFDNDMKIEMEPYLILTFRIWWNYEIAMLAFAIFINITLVSLKKYIMKTSYCSCLYILQICTYFALHFSMDIICNISKWNILNYIYIYKDNELIHYYFWNLCISIPVLPVCIVKFVLCYVCVLPIILSPTLYCNPCIHV